jgi:hypothetical protein
LTEYPFGWVSNAISWLILLWDSIHLHWWHSADQGGPLLCRHLLLKPAITAILSDADFMFDLALLQPYLEAQPKTLLNALNRYCWSGWVSKAVLHNKWGLLTNSCRSGMYLYFPRNWPEKGNNWHTNQTPVSCI